METPSAMAMMQAAISANRGFAARLSAQYQQALVKPNASKCSVLICQLASQGIVAAR